MQFYNFRYGFGNKVDVRKLIGGAVTLWQLITFNKASLRFMCFITENLYNLRF